MDEFHVGLNGLADTAVLYDHRVITLHLLLVTTNVHQRLAFHQHLGRTRNVSSSCASGDVNRRAGTLSSLWVLKKALPNLTQAADLYSSRQEVYSRGRSLSTESRAESEVKVQEPKKL